MKQSAAKFYVDHMIAEIMLSDDELRKKAGITSNIKDSVVNYFENHVDPDDKVGSFLNFILPGTLSMLVGGWLGPTLGFALRVLNIDIAGILSSIYDKIKGLVSDGHSINSDQIDGAVNAAIQTHSGGEQLGGTAYVEGAKFLKQAVMSYHNETIPEENLKVIFAAYGRRGKALGTIGRLLSWIIKTAAVSAGLMVAGDAANKMLGRPNAFDDTIQKGKPVEQAPEAPRAPLSKQTKFPVKPGYSDLQHNTSTNWIERYPNTESGISSMLVNFAKEVYDGLDGAESAIMASPTFKATVDNIAWYNHASAGDPVVFIPRNFTSKKQLVDHFIDEVAAKAVSPAPTPMTPPSQSTPFEGIPRRNLA